MEEVLPADVMESKQAKAEESKLKAEEIRQKEVETYGQTKIRTTSDVLEAEPKKKKRRGGNDIIDWIPERKIWARDRSQEKLKELQSKEKEQERSFEQQKEMMPLMQHHISTKAWWSCYPNW